jgi:CDP-diacylglycerol--serine O-phosphatidyltransferase
MKMTKRIVPDTITACNLLCGAVATFLATQHAFMLAFCFILLGAFFDFFDGLSARLLKAPSRIGIELDSLADVITFGLAPAMLVACYYLPILGWWSFLALVMAAFSALRLAKFNVDERQTSSFIGLATPANAIFWGGICSMPYGFTTGIATSWGLLALTFVSCWLLVSEIPFFSLKFKNFTWSDNYDKYIFLAGAFILIVFCAVKAYLAKQWGFLLFSGSGVILWYVVLNILTNIMKPKK